jgi:hypothetical protein
MDPTTEIFNFMLKKFSRTGWIQLAEMWRNFFGGAIFSAGTVFN